MTQEIKDRLKAAREKAGFASAADAADALGIKTPTYTHHENGTRKPKAEAIERYARFFGVSLTWLMFGKDLAPTEPEQARPTAKQHKIASLLTPFTVPVYGSISGRDEDYLEATGEALDQIGAPGSLMGIEGAFALYMPGSSMEPRYHEGETLFVNPKKLPRPGEYTAVLHEKQGIPVWQVGRYERVESGFRVLSRYNGSELRIPTDEIRAMHKIIATGEW
ncbi:Helix-turn-helix domain protein [Pseudovibrio sp. Ad13]|uniref:XRE family transcriptional regulator n=1 Tax=Pseudovibrio sp. Ad13 TaxID=989396 RepID=UPI0007AE6976|nr:LexA family transcriptional regulator [Pseudovibrio sp. Ad13]KZK82997.1 Helix-turn-helix domain protein [Pseudovibrio sp. Ad13]